VGARKRPAGGGDAKAPAFTRLVLVRHAVTADTGSVLSGRTPGIDLSEEGRAQAKAVAERLAATRPAAVYASPIERTRQTAEAIAEPHGLPVTDLPGVIECEYGGWTGQKLGDLAKTDLWRVVQRAPSRASFPEGESIAAMQARAVEALDGVVAAHPGGVVVVVSHSDVIKAAAAHYAGMHLDLFQRIVISPASVTAFAFPGDGAPVLLTMNDAGSLDVLGPPPEPPPPAAEPDSDGAGT
jgi:probable phosphoglycerate mutase